MNNMSSMEQKSDSVRVPLLDEGDLQQLAIESSKKTKNAMVGVVIVNVILLIVKIVALSWTGSISILSSMVDSALDLTSQGILWFVEKKANTPDLKKYMAGRTRLEPVGIIFMAAVMSMAAVEILRDSIVELCESALEDSPDQPRWSFFAAFGMTLAFVLKLVVFLYMRQIGNPITDALAKDACNDVLSNLVALFAFSLASKWESLWFLDQIGAIIISVYIILSWVDVGREQTRKLTGIAASEEQNSIIREIVRKHEKLQLDVLRAYHIGRCLLVELEVIMPEESCLKEVHDESLCLQQQVEKLRFVERCFVHVDYETRDYNEHKDALLV